MISKKMIFVDEELLSRDSILDKVSKSALKEKYIENSNDFKKCLLHRETIVPTSIGFEVAIPHCRSENIKKPFIAFMRLKENILWDERSEELVKLIFTLGVPKDKGNGLHLKFLSAISKKLIHEEFRNKLKHIENPDEIFKLLKEINQEIGEV